MSLAIWWVRRDLRLADNPALHAAHQHGAVLPLFIIDPALQASPWFSPRRWAFLLASLHTLHADLLSRGSRLLIRTGNPRTILAELLAETGATAIYAQADASPYATNRDTDLARTLPLTLTSGLTVQPIGSVLKDDGQPYTVFTPYSRRWKSRPTPTPDDLLPAPPHLTTPPTPLGDLLPPVPATVDLTPFPPSEAEAQRRLTAFLANAIYTYHHQRDLPAEPGTALLSPYFRFGLLSARQAAVAAYQAMRTAPTVAARDSADTWLTELIWREFYTDILYHYPHVRRTSFRPDWQHIPWRDAPAEFEAWATGHTGYPIVDAAMRQLLTLGWMHNRARMIVASFLVKDLLIDWRRGEQHFMHHLLDGDPAANNGGWQWAAGTGTDAAPYFRIFNPVSQSTKFDPAGHYIRRWAPELAPVPNRYIHAPWEMPPDVQHMVGVIIGHTYPAPIVDHAFARQRTLAAYAESKAKFGPAHIP